MKILQLTLSEMHSCQPSHMLGKLHQTYSWAPKGLKFTSDCLTLVIYSLPPSLLCFYWKVGNAPQPVTWTQTPIWLSAKHAPHVIVCQESLSDSTFWTLTTGLSLCGSKDYDSFEPWSSKIWYTWTMSLVFVWFKKSIRSRSMLDRYIGECTISTTNIDNGITTPTCGYFKS